MPRQANAGRLFLKRLEKKLWSHAASVQTTGSPQQGHPAASRCPTLPRHHSTQVQLSHCPLDKTLSIHSSARSPEQHFFSDALPLLIAGVGGLIIEGSLEIKLPTIWRDEKTVSREKSQKRKDQKKEDAGARKGREVAKHCVFSCFGGSGGSKSRLAKAAGAEPAGQMRDAKVHAVVARSTFPSQNVQSTPGPDHFWQLRC